MTRQENIAALTLQRDRLAGCNTLEAYRDCHISFLNFLIKAFLAEEEREQRIAEILEQEGLV